MALIEDNGNFYRPQNVPVRQTPPRPPARPVDRYSSPEANRGPSNNGTPQMDGYHRAEMNRFNLLRDLNTDRVNERTATESAQEVRDAYNNPPTGTSPQAAAARRLVEVTEDQSPEAVALTVEYLQPTLNQIGIDLNAIAKDNDGDYGNDKPEFDDVINDLAIVSNRAVAAENGNEAVTIIADSIVSNIDSDEIGRFDEAFGRTVENGNPELAAEVITQLQAAGRTDQADDILQNVEDGINNIREDLSDAVGDADRYTEELGWLIAQWQPGASEEDIAAGIEAYKAENPEYQEALDRIDELSVHALRATNTFQDTETDFAGLGHADDVAGALEHLMTDENVQFGIAQSQAATDEVAILLDRAENNPQANNILDGIIKVAGSTDDGDFLTEVIFNKAFDITIDRALGATTEVGIDANGSRRVDDFGRIDNAATQIDQLGEYAERLGYSSDEFTAVLDELKHVSESSDVGQARNRIRGLTRSLDELGESNPDLFGSDSRFYNKFKSFGLFLGAVGAASSIEGAISDPDALNIINAIVDSSDVVVSALDTEIATRLMRNQPWFSNLPLERAGKVLGGIGLVLDAYSIGSDLADGNYAEAGFSTVGAGGGALIAFGTTAASTGVGLILVVGALAASYQYGRVQASNIHETDGARAFLEGMGIDPDLANELINNDSKGRSAAPVLFELANRLEIEPSEMFEYLSTLSPGDAKNLIETAHGVDPDDEGNFPESIPQPQVYRNVESSTPNDVNDLIDWMRDNGYEDAPGL